MNISSGFLGEGCYFKERKDHVVKLLLKVFTEVKPTQMVTGLRPAQKIEPSRPTPNIMRSDLSPSIGQY